MVLLKHFLITELFLLRASAIEIDVTVTRVTARKISGKSLHQDKKQRPAKRDEKARHHDKTAALEARQTYVV